MKNHHQFKKKDKFGRAPAHLSQEGQVVISLGGFQHVYTCVHNHKTTCSHCI